MRSIGSFLAIGCVFIGITQANAQRNEFLSFDNPEFFISKIVRNTAVRPNLNSELFWNYRTRIREASRAEPNFAGRYSLDYWGCGTSCQVGVVVNLVTGEVIMIPMATLGYEYHVHSALLVVNPPEDGEVLAQRPDYSWPEYYLFNGKDFLLLHSGRY